MDADELKQWREAGRLAAKALDFGRKLIKPGASLREVSAAIDKRILELGARPAWPTQIGCDDTAAHYAADAERDIIFKEQVVKLDVGVHLDGIVGDNATTIDLSGEHGELLAASRDALDAAIRIVRAGLPIGEIGRAVQEAIVARGFAPVRNLTGHGITPWTIHDAPSIPNIDTGDKQTLVAGQIIAIEPFATNGAGMVVEAEPSGLFSLERKKPVRSPIAREVLAHIEAEYRSLPFCTRWLADKFGVGKAKFALRELLATGCLHSYPPLVEKAGGLVSVFEHTLHVKDGKAEILTKLE